MPEDSTSPPDPTPPAEESAQSPEPTPPPEAEWTDDIGSAMSEQAAPIPDPGKASTDEWEDSLDWEEDPVESPSPQPSATSTQEALAWLRPLWRQGVAAWQRLLAGIRTRIPAAAKLSNRALSAILIGGLVLLITILNSGRQPSVAIEGPEEPTPPVSPRVDSEPEGQPSLADDLSTDTAPPATPALPPPSSDELDPAERDRIADIQTQLIDGSLSYGQGLVESVQADFKRNRLTINLSSGWYRLSDYEQEELADTLMQRSTQMAFEDLQLRSPAGDLLARSPVIGDAIVILQREKPPEVELPPRPRYRITIDR
ncbi:MAG: hypothetical protein F6J95_016955 [Leptolyngbya sp. SIO1E4]|nr:hypothetical protein [Leptolyngbya sp. SIO1E4]